jgi:hypothetical protein
MATGSGLDAQFGYKFESVYGTGVTVDLFNDFNKETLKLDTKRTDPKGLAAGRLYPLIARNTETTRVVSGGVEMDFSVKSMGRIVKLMVGSTVTTPTIISGAAYKQVHQSGGLVGLSQTWQFGRPQRDGTVKPFTGVGMKCKGWTISSKVGELVGLTMDMIGKDLVTSTALASASYLTGNEIFRHNDLVVKLGGTASTTSGIVSVASGVVASTVINGVDVKSENPLSESYGTSATIQTPNQNGMANTTIDFDGEFTSQSEIYDVWRAGSIIPVQLTWTGSTISGGAYTLDIIASACKFSDEDLNVDGPDVLGEKPSLTVGSDGVNSPLQITLISTDSAAL